jgi:hypothetical protein
MRSHSAECIEKKNYFLFHSFITCFYPFIFMIIEGPRSAAPVRECVDESTAPIPSQAGSQWCASAKRDHKAGLVAQANQGRNKTPRHAALIPMDR